MLRLNFFDYTIAKFYNILKKIMLMKCKSVVFFAMIASFILLSGCAKQSGLNKSEAKKNNEIYKMSNDAYNFSFSYQSGWDEIKRDLPQKWAIVSPSKDTMLFVVDKAKSNNTLALGRSQALRDLYPQNKVTELNGEKLKEVFSIVTLKSLNNNTWYTYGLQFADKNISSIVSGTICNGNEIIIVMVSRYESLVENEDNYAKILNSFKCGIA